MIGDPMLCVDAGAKYSDGGARGRAARRGVDGVYTRGDGPVETLWRSTEWKRREELCATRR